MISFKRNKPNLGIFYRFSQKIRKITSVFDSSGCNLSLKILFFLEAIQIPGFPSLVIELLLPFFFIN